MKEFCLITGAASGIGYEFARIFADQDYNLVLVDLNATKLSEIKNDFEEKYHCRIENMIINLTDPQAAQKIYETTKSQGIKIQVLVNNAGFGVFGSFYEADQRRQLDLLQLSVTTTTQLTHLFLKDMINRNSGKILNVSSIAAFQPGPFMAVYYASKAYLLHFGMALANELKDTNITVTTLCPGVTKTNFQRSNGNLLPKFGVFSASPEKVAGYGYISLMRGKPLAIPCFYNRVIAALHRFMPLRSATQLSRLIQTTNRNEELVTSEWRERRVIH
ncbi:SDR family oxidoreductase [Maribellus sp. YY47]|uniref:SDR family NAD(P)-dependent oxidoreductase n=1 Tax=Maribellus sp. YY47 TaxID=2929486 RepID=UPI002001C008|nr:SDR family oxidoreductase [Maribellus sp. YY47]MCK3684175.1 SDR family oxidoreductase [Maribellus sp. YY47]